MGLALKIHDNIRRKEEFFVFFKMKRGRDDDVEWAPSTPTRSFRPSCQQLSHVEIAQRQQHDRQQSLLLSGAGSKSDGSNAIQLQLMTGPMRIRKAIHDGYQVKDKSLAGNVYLRTDVASEESSRAPDPCEVIDDKDIPSWLRRR